MKLWLIEYTYTFFLRDYIFHSAPIRIWKIMKEPFVGWKRIPQELNIPYFIWNSWLNRVYQLSSLAQSAPSRLPRWWILQSKIFKKIYWEPLIHALSPCDGLVEYFFNLIQSPLGRGPRDDLDTQLLNIFGKSVPIWNFKKRYKYHLNISKRYPIFQS